LSLVSLFIKNISLTDFDKIIIENAIKKILKKININEATYKEKILPRISAYIVCDHLRTLILALSDYAIPSNVGGGYNLRTIIRRLLNFKTNLEDFDIYKLAEKEIKILRNFKHIPKETLP
ncbi:alanine--tRNA ligase-related protein, partial [Escherichia coli]|uniref:alanine--tRNA ligase-related protein n=1 Tax=Escherichia coli TaxID=562 RepID=UPI0012C9603F